MKRILHLATCIALTLTASAFEPDVVIDAHTDTAAVELGGSGWANETTVTNAFRGDSKLVASATGANFARFHTRLPKAGVYSVFVWHNGGTSYFGYNLTTQVTHEAGTTAVFLNQSSNAGQWLLLGTFWFDGIEDGDPNTPPNPEAIEAEVKIIGPSYGKLSADAVRFVPATADVTLDSDSAGVTAAGTWTTVSDKAGMGGTIRRSDAGAATMTYATVLPARGDYEVLLWLPGSGGAWAASFDVDVYHRTGTTTVNVSLPSLFANEGRWVQMVNPATANEPAPRTGTFRFNSTPALPAANPNKVVIKSNGTAGVYVPADVLRVTKAGPFSVLMDEDDPAVPFPDPGNWANNTTQSWAVPWSVNPALRFGSAYKSVNFTSSSPSAQSMVYSPALTELGLYDVYVWYPVHSYYSGYNNPGTQVIAHSALGDVTRTVNQTVGTGRWGHAGRFIFQAGDDPDPPKFTISTPVNPYNQQTQNYQWSSWWYQNQGHVLADGVMFVRDNEEADLDLDWLSDWRERLLGTDTYDENGNAINGNGGGFSPWDTDGDGMSDGYEVLHSAHGHDPLTAHSTEADYDGDGVSDLVEHTANTAPEDPAPALGITKPYEATFTP